MKAFKLALSLGILSLVSGAAGQVITLKKVGDKTIGCWRSGLSNGGLNDCGFHSDRYTYVFVGKISAVTAFEHDEQRIQIIPQEVFAGKPKKMNVVTSQGLCLPKLVVGDQWLFYLRRDGSKPIVLDYYGNDSLPLSEASEKVTILRRLKTMKHSGILRGKVWNGDKPTPSVPVFAVRSDGRRFTTTTEPDGRYEFPAILPGEYKVSTQATAAYQRGKRGTGEFEIEPQSCWDLELSAAR